MQKGKSKSRSNDEIKELNSNKGQIVSFQDYYFVVTNIFSPSVAFFAEPVILED